MACRLLLTRKIRIPLLSLSISPHSSQSLKTLISLFPSKFHNYPSSFRSFSSQLPQKPNLTSSWIQIYEEEDDVDGEDEEDYSSAEEEQIDGNVGKRSVNELACLEERSYYVEDKLIEVADIGYKVVGPLNPEDRVFKHYEPAFDVVQVMFVGSPTQTIIGRPILPEASVHAIVEEHALDAKVIIFKKKRRKNYRRTKGHRQELTRLRITDIQGIEKAGSPFLGKILKKYATKLENVAVPA